MGTEPTAVRTNRCGVPRAGGTGRALGMLAMLLLAVLVVAEPRGWAQRPGDPDKKRSEKKRASGEKSKKTSSAEDQKDAPLTAIVGADIYTVSREIIRRGTVLIEGDKIKAVGQDIKLPEKAKVIRAEGKYVTPGFIAMSASRIGFESSGGKIQDRLDPFDRNLKYCLGVGITTAAVRAGGSSFFFGRSPEDDQYLLRENRFLGLEPERESLSSADWNPDFGPPDSSTCPCCGLPIDPVEPIVPSGSTSITSQNFTVLKMSYGELAPMLVSESPFYSVSSRALRGSLNRHTWRTSIEKAKQYVKAVAEHQQKVNDGKKDRPPRKTVSDELVKLVKKEIYLRVQADSVDEIRDMVALAKELDYRLMLDGAAEGWVVVDALSDRRVPVIFTPRRSPREPRVGAEDRSGSSIEMPGIFEASGVPFAVSSLSSFISLNGLAGRDLTSLPLEAAFAVRGGCSEKTALAALTIVPAQLLGLQDRIGSIEPGKDADLLILDGPPLDYRTYVETALVAGKVRYERAKDKIYPVFDRDKLQLGGHPPESESTQSAQ